MCPGKWGGQSLVPALVSAHWVLGHIPILNTVHSKIYDVSYHLPEILVELVLCYSTLSRKFDL